MINKDRLVNEFIQLVKIDSLTKKERNMADCLKEKISSMGYSPEEDDAGLKIGGNCGNILFRVNGNKEADAILLMAHIDTVTPGEGKLPIIDGDIIKTNGTTILGSDDLSGVVVILEAIRVLKEQNINHGDIYVAFTVGEEGGLLGSKNLDYSKLPVKFAFVLDNGGEIGTVSVSAPSQHQIAVKIHGKSSHAGVEPEKGISAVTIASNAIASMTLGRIDEETTANIGIIKGGKATNIVCDYVEIQAEARSRNAQKLQTQTEHMKDCFVKACQDFGGKLDFQYELEYPAFNINESEKIIDILKWAAEKSDIPLKLTATGGGSDTNTVNSKGISAVDISVGMNNVHTANENVSINDMILATRFLISIIESSII